MKQIIEQFFEHIGEDKNREGLKGTPDRVIKMWSEIFRGYKEQPPKITVFNNGSDGIVYDQMITDTGDFYSHCEHHIVPFFGQYWFGYVPNKKGLILGLSKVARIVDYHAAKLQIQERLTSDIVNELWDALCNETEPLGMILVMEGEHLCKSMRGVKKKGKMKTSYIKGIFKEAEVRNEFLNLIK